MPDDFVEYSLIPQCYIPVYKHDDLSILLRKEELKEIREVCQIEQDYFSGHFKRFDKILNELKQTQGPHGSHLTT